MIYDIRNIYVNFVVIRRWLNVSEEIETIGPLWPTMAEISPFFRNKIFTFSSNFHLIFISVLTLSLTLSGVRHANFSFRL